MTQAPSVNLASPSTRAGSAASIMLAARVRPVTRRRYGECLALAAALDDRTTADRVLRRALGNYFRRQVAECLKRGVDPRAALAACPPEPTPTGPPVRGYAPRIVR